MSIIDAHANIGQGRRLSLSVDSLLAQMDEAGVSMAIISPVDHYLAVHNREGNDLILDVVRRHENRLVGMALANPWFGDTAVEELRRALQGGLRGLAIHSVCQGFRLSDPIVDPLLDVAATFGVPVCARG